MYAAELDTFTLTFNTSGALWGDALVMIDDQTGTLWSQPTGEAIRGPLEGKRLRALPTQHLTYAEFAEQYPDGKLLSKPERGEAGSRYRKYFQNPDRLGVFGRANTFTRLPAKELVYGLRIDDRAIAVTDSLLTTVGVTTITSHVGSIAIVGGGESGFVSAFVLPESDIAHLRLSGRRLVSNAHRWSAITGKALSDNTQDLQPQPVMTAFWFAWVSFFPDTELIN